VHWHDIRLQLIFCYKGWVRVVYEDQGPPFVMQPGDCVLQPPRIRHRVLECSDGFEAVEISAPAEHETHVDHTMRLPSSDAAVERLFADQRFVFFQAGAHEWQPGPATGLEYLDGGFDAATAGIASLQIFRSCSPSMTVPVPPQSGFQFAFVLHGSARLRQVASEVDIGATDAFTVAAGKPWQLDAMSDDFRLLKVVCPGLA
jgi:quercetin dioxygenase-like cupin family protein